MATGKVINLCVVLAVAAAVHAGGGCGGDVVSLAGRWNFALGDSTNCTDTIALPSTTDIARKGDGRIRGVEVEKIDPMRDDAAVQNRLTRHLTRRFPYVGKSTYEREIEIPVAWAGRRIELFLERTKVVDAYLDGARFGRSDTLAAPVVIELPRGTTPGRHTLRLVVDNRRGTVPITGHQTAEDTQTNWNGGEVAHVLLADGSARAVPTIYVRQRGKIRCRCPDRALRPGGYPDGRVTMADRGCRKLWRNGYWENGHLARSCG